MRTLVLCDDYWHPARTARAGLGALNDDGLEFDWIEHAGEWSAERMAEYPLVVLTKANNISATDQQPWVTEAVEQAFFEYVRSGNGLLAIHYAVSRVFDRDDTTDLSKTMAALDGRLKMAERWAQLFERYRVSRAA